MSTCFGHIISLYALYVCVYCRCLTDPLSLKVHNDLLILPFIHLCTKYMSYIYTHLSLSELYKSFIPVVTTDVQRSSKVNDNKYKS